MGKDLKNIDEFIKRGLIDFQAPPPADAWDAIAQQVQKPQRKLIPVFWRWAAAVAIIIGLSFILNTRLSGPDAGSLSKSETVKLDQQNKRGEAEKQNPLLEDRDIPNNQDTEKDSGSKELPASDYQKTKTGPGQQSDNLPTLTKLLANSSEKTDIASKAEKENFATDENLIADMPENRHEIAGEGNIENTNKAEKNKIAGDKNLIADIPEIEQKIAGEGNIENKTADKEHPLVDQDQKSVVIIDDQSSTKSTDIIKDNNPKTGIPDLPKDLLADNKREANWSVGGGVSPVYSFRNTNTKEGGDSYAWPGGENNEKNEHPILAFSGGLDVEYHARRWSISSGVYYSQSGQETDNFSFNRIIIFNSQTNIYASTSAGNIAYEQVSKGFIEGFDIDGDNAYLPSALESEPIESDAVLRQDFEYLEVPLIAKYKLIDRKIDVHFLAGLSTSFLMGNSNVLQYSSKELDMGKIDNLRSVNYNSLVGLGFQYPFTRSLRFRLQPMFKYALKPINEEYSINSFPYSFAIYTGIAFDF